MFSSIALLCVSLLPLAISAPTKREGVVGAAYVINNDPSGNSIIASNIGEDGTLSFGAAIPAGGIGLHGNNTNPNAGDPLFSQDAIKVVDGYLFTVNSGSNTVVMFKINPSYPSDLTMIGQPVNSGGEFPMSLAVSSSGQVCVLNGGAVSNVSCFKADSSNGLVPMADGTRMLPLNRTTPPSGPPGTTSDIIFTPFNKLLASVKGFSQDKRGYIAEWSVDPTTGALSRDFKINTIPSPGMNPFSMTLVPGTNAILNTDPATGYAIWDFATTPAVANVVSVPGQKAICWSTYSAFTQSFFLMDAGASRIIEVVVDKSLKTSILNHYQLATGSGPLDGAVGTIAGKDYLYVLSAGSASIDVLSLLRKGHAKPVQTLNITEAVGSGAPVSSRNLAGMAVYTIE